MEMESRDHVYWKYFQLPWAYIKEYVMLFSDITKYICDLY